VQKAQITLKILIQSRAANYSLQHSSVAVLLERKYYHDNDNDNGNNDVW
jgi:hypothetical protein